MKIFFAVSLLVVAVSSHNAVAGEPEERQEVAQNAASAIQSKDFKKLNYVFDLLQSNNQKTSSGSRKILTFVNTISVPQLKNTSNPELPYIALEDLTFKWVTENPLSPFAIALHARVIMNHGSFFRGDVYADAVTPEAWKKFRTKVIEAENFLAKNKSVGAKRADWYIANLEVGRLIGRKKQIQMSLALEATTKFPDEDGIPRSMVQYLLPKWHGSADEINDYILLNTSGQPRNLELYTRLYADVSFNQYQDRLFEESKVEWQKMKVGFQEINKKYPTDWNKNMFAYYSCLARDGEAAKTLLSEIGNTPILQRWGENPKRTYLMCRQWASKL